MDPYDLTPLLKPIVRVLMETTDNAMLDELFDVFRVVMRNGAPPSAICPDLYRIFKETFTAPLEGTAKANALGFQAELLKRLGISFLANPPVSDSAAKNFALSIMLELYQDLIQDMTADTEPNTEPERRILLKFAALQATINFCWSTDTKPFTTEELEPVRKLAFTAIGDLSKFVKGKYARQQPHDSNAASFDPDSHVDAEAIQCITTWITKGGIHGQNDGLLYMMTIYGDMYGCEPDELTLDAIKGIRGLVEFTVDGSAQFLKWKDIWLSALANNLGMIEKNIPMPGTVSQITCEIFRLMTLMVQKHPKAIVKEELVKEFPGELYTCVDKDAWIEPNAEVKRAGAVLAVEVLLVLPKRRKSSGDLLTKWRAKLADLLPQEDPLILAIDQATH